MAKQDKEVTTSWEDFNEDNLIEVEEEETETGEEEQEEEQEEEKPAKPKKVAAKKKEEEAEEETQEEEEEVKVKPKPKKAAKAEEKEVEEEEQEEETEEEEENDSPDPVKFFEEVEKLTGQEVEVEYGDVDPLTPQGVAIRDAAVREAAVDGFLAEIEQNYPAAFRALQHAHNGGDVAELFKAISARDYSKVVLEENSTDLAKSILREYYENKGIKNPKRIDRFIKDAEDSDEGLITEAKSALEELKEEQASKADEAIKIQQAKAEDQRKKDKLIVSAIDEVLEGGELGTFKLASRQEATEFRKFVLGNMRRTADGFELSTPVEASNLGKILQYQYFQYKKGELGKLIQIKASSENAQKLKLRLKSEEGNKKKGAGLEKKKSEESGSLRDFDLE